MKYARNVYEKWDAFYASILSEAESRINTYNFLIRELSGRSPDDIKNVRKGLNISSVILGRVGWEVFLIICTLFAAGYLGFFGGIGTLIATNPLLAAALVVIGGGNAV